MVLTLQSVPTRNTSNDLQRPQQATRIPTPPTTSHAAPAAQRARVRSLQSPRWPTSNAVLKIFIPKAGRKALIPKAGRKALMPKAGRKALKPKPAKAGVRQQVHPCLHGPRHRPGGFSEKRGAPPPCFGHRQCFQRRCALACLRHRRCLQRSLRHATGYGCLRLRLRRLRQIQGRGEQKFR